MILVEDNEYVLRYISYINEYKYKIVKKESINKLKKEYDMYFFMINELSDLDNINFTFSKILIFIKDIDVNLLWKIHNICNCVDVIYVSNNTESILERIRSNLKKGEFNEKTDNNF